MGEVVDSLGKERRVYGLFQNAGGKRECQKLTDGTALLGMAREVRRSAAPFAATAPEARRLRAMLKDRG
jgi:hypothetical protein